MIASLCMLVCAAGVDVQSQHLAVEITPAAHAVSVVSEITAEGEGELILRLAELAEIQLVMVDGQAAEYTLAEPDSEDAHAALVLNLTGEAAHNIAIAYSATFEQDISAGERVGQIHNFSVDAHIGPGGIFLSDGSAWHPQPIGADGHTALHMISIDIKPVEGWALVASGDPVDEGDITAPRWKWKMPRPIDTAAIVGNKHVLHGRTHDTPHGPVEVVMHVPEAHADFAPMFVDAACDYLDLYTPLLGAFPFKRFSIVENFFSSGFGYPGFTVLGPRVVAMAPRSLMPGFLDHELIHNWWGNGVYVDPEGGNWCEGMTTYCANYYRRIADGGEEAGREYRRGTLMKLSADPNNLDNGPLAKFGSADSSDGGTHRFVGYDKGAFIFIMLEKAKPIREGQIKRDQVWKSLRKFAADNMGKRAGWPQIQAAFQDGFGRNLGTYFGRWVNTATKPMTPTTGDGMGIIGFAMSYAQDVEFIKKDGEDENRKWFELDPDFYLYRVLPPEQVVPLIGGTQGPGGMKLISSSDRPEIEVCRQMFELDDEGENLLIVGAEAVKENESLIAAGADPITIGDGSFTVGGVTYDQPNQAVMHTISNPEKPGRFITVFVSNGDVGWAKLRLIIHYARDTTVVWEDGEVLHRRFFEPPRVIYK
ncbi:MAG: hypothetical protein JSV91_08625 [Phycisphaerales bacterium]|nr:MAG: hypothetical protein JSV91_08625 [Phycisphaerales bacterium]